MYSLLLNGNTEKKDRQIFTNFILNRQIYEKFISLLF